MRPVSGLDRPGFQWLFIALAFILIAITAGEAVRLRRARQEIDSLRAAELNAQIEQDKLRGQAARERAARESFTLELARDRGRGAQATQPTLTLSPLVKRGPQPPDPTVAKPAEQQSIQLRLLLPPRRDSANATYSITIRTWSGGDAVWSRSGVTASTIDAKHMVTAFITGDVFAPGAYEISLRRMADQGAVEVAMYEVGVRSEKLEVRSEK